MKPAATRVNFPCPWASPAATFRSSKRQVVGRDESRGPDDVWKGEAVMNTWRYALAMMFAISFAVSADVPLRPPSTIEHWSPNRRFCAVSVPGLLSQTNMNRDRTTVYEVGSKGKRIEKWSIEGWFRVGEPSNDGEYFVAGYDGMNLLPRSELPDNSNLGGIDILRIYRRGRLTTTIRLREVVRNLRNLERTVSHYHWGDYLGFNQAGRSVVTTCEGDRIEVDPAHPKVLKRARCKDSVPRCSCCGERAD